MLTLFDRSGRAVIRLYDDWFVAYSQALHLGWLGTGGGVYDRRGRFVGWLSDGRLRDRAGRIVATDHGSVYPGMAGIPGRPGKPGLSGVPGRPGFSSAWSSTTYKDLFGAQR